MEARELTTEELDAVFGGADFVQCSCGGRVTTNDVMSGLGTVASIGGAIQILCRSCAAKKAQGKDLTAGF